MNDTSKRQETLEMVENTLITKLDQKEAEVSDLKDLINEMRTEMEVKSDAIGKAQAIIEKFSEKSDSDDVAINRLTAERDQLKEKLNVAKKNIKDIS